MRKKIGKRKIDKLKKLVKEKKRLEAQERKDRAEALEALRLSSSNKVDQPRPTPAPKEISISPPTGNERPPSLEGLSSIEIECLLLDEGLNPRELAWWRSRKRRSEQQYIPSLEKRRWH